ncbi:MAG: carbohydrate ABC transporter permease [Clostridia bacterium]|nr:carbohydrate ABC transporter permease [Clostridia bacterium]
MVKFKKWLKTIKLSNILIAILRHAFLLGISYVVLFPLLYMLSNAFKPVDQYFDPSVVWIPKSLTLENFKVVSLVIDLGKVFLETFLVFIITAVISAFVCMIVGYGFSRSRLKGKNIAMALLILTIIVPQQTISVSLYSSFRYLDLFGILGALHKVIPAIGPINLIGTPWVTIVPALFGVVLKSGMFIFIYMQFFRGLPKELEEAASIDGCGSFHTFFKIIVPTTKNVTIAVLLLSIVWNWNDYYTPSMFIRTRETIAVALSNLKSYLDNLHNMGLGVDIQTAETQIQAGCLIAIVPLLILYIILQKRFTEGIENSGITGQ